MIEVRIGGQPMDLFEGTTISYDLNSSIFSTSDASQLPGSYSFPFSVPVTARNLRLLNYPTIVTSAHNYVPVYGDLFADGVLLFSGKITVSDAQESAVELYMVASQVADLRNYKLNELDLGGIREIGAGSMLAHAKDTAINPDNYDYIFFPILNSRFIEGRVASFYLWFQNYWNTNTQSFVVDDNRPVLTPSVKLSYILERIFSYTDYAFRNEFQDLPELQNLVLYGNYSLYGQNGLHSSITLNNHVSETTATDFLKKLSGTFQLGLFLDHYRKTVRLVPIRKIINTPAQHDWTAKAHEGIKISPPSDAPSGYMYEPDSSDYVFQALQGVNPPTVFTTVNTPADVTADGVYYIVSTHTYWNVVSGNLTYLHTDFGKVPAANDIKARGGESKLFQARLQPLMDAHGYFTMPGHTYLMFPSIEQPGTCEYLAGLDELGNPTWQMQRNNVPDRITCYRGMHAAPDLSLYPYASGLPYDPDGATIGQLSLRWDGDDGLYARWVQPWHEMLSKGKHCTVRVNLTAKDIQQFSLDQKIRIGQMEYLVKSLKVTITMQGIQPVEASLVSVI